MTTDIWAEERRAYYGALADEAELELLARELEVLELRVGRRDAGHRYARMLGLPETFGPVVAIMIFSADRAHRARAAGIIVREFMRRARGQEAA